MPASLKILMIRLSSIGDIVLTTPVIRCVKQQIPDVELHFLIKPQFEDVLKANPYIDQLHFLKESLWDTGRELKKEKFDVVIDLHNNQRTFLIKTFLGVKSHSFYKQNVEKWSMVNFKINRLKPVSIVERYLDAARPLGIKNDGAGLDYFIPKEEEVNILELPAKFHSGYVGFVIGAVHYTKKFPVHKVIETCKALNKPVIILGGKAEQEAGEAISQATGAYNACGKYSLNQSASIVKQAEKIITNDTGLMHIAAAFQKPIITLWGNTIPEFGMFPYYGDQENRAQIMEVKGLSCRPCSKIGFDKCPKEHFKCMEQIDVLEVVRSIQQS